MPIESFYPEAFYIKRINGLALYGAFWYVVVPLYFLYKLGII